MEDSKIFELHSPTLKNVMKTSIYLFCGIVVIPIIFLIANLIFNFIDSGDIIDSFFIFVAIGLVSALIVVPSISLLVYWKIDVNGDKVVIRRLFRRVECELSDIVGYYFFERVREYYLVIHFKGIKDIRMLPGIYDEEIIAFFDSINIMQTKRRAKKASNRFNV